MKDNIHDTVDQDFVNERNQGTTQGPERVSLLDLTSKERGEQSLASSHGNGPPMSRKRIMKNLIVLSLSFMCLFTAFQSLQNLQSSLNKEQGLGTTSLSVIYVTGTISGLCIPPLIIKRLGCKWTLVVSMMCYVVFMAANLYATWATMIPASIILGAGAAPLWAAKCTYLTQLGVWYGKLTKTTKDGAISTFFGFFFMFFQSSQIWGNLISSAVFSQDIHDDVTNVSVPMGNRCGSSYCPLDYANNTLLDRPDMSKIYAVCGIYLGSACLAVLLNVVLLDKLCQDSADQTRTTGQLLTAIFRHFYASRYQMLLVPLTIYSGVQQAFIAGEFTRSFIGCAIGVWNIGYVMIVYGVTDAVCSLIIGHLVRYTRFLPWFIAVFVVHGGCLVVLYVWPPSGSQLPVFYIIAALWGFGDSIIQTLINGFYGYLFSDNPEAAFASYRILESVGFILAFGYSNSLCTDAKILVCIVLLVVGVVLYAVTEFLHRRQNTHEKGTTNDQKGQPTTEGTTNDRKGHPTTDKS